MTVHELCVFCILYLTEWLIIFSSPSPIRFDWLPYCAPIPSQFFIPLGAPMRDWQLASWLRTRTEQMSDAVDRRWRAYIVSGISCRNSPGVEYIINLRLCTSGDSSEWRSEMRQQRSTDSTSLLTSSSSSSTTFITLVFLLFLLVASDLTEAGNARLSNYTIK